MSSEDQETAPVAAEELPVETEKKSASKKGKSGAAGGASPAKKKKKSSKNQRGRYSQLVLEIIENLGAKNGSSLAKIANEAKKVPWFDLQNGRTYLKYSVKALKHNETLVQVKGTGVNGSFKINKKKLEGQKGKKKAASPSKATKPAAKKLVKKTPKAKTSAKKEKKSAKVTAGAKKKVVAKSKKTKKATTAGAKKEKKGTKGKTQKKSKSKKA
ncbi:histone H1.10-like [Latimeria chalumnae]|uniref:histone H1.10-like n=1 Tax=Latimeria chalumnae TaxID=7897 RepID=UPI00313DE336